YPGHGSTRLMRIMQTNACSLSCGYCPTFCGGNVRRTYLTPEEVARVFMDAHRKGLADGLFLTSGVPGRGDRMTDRMLAAVELLRVVPRLERERLLHHAHFSAFQPVVGTPMENAPPTPPVRELRLYQAEHLLRQYGFGVDELAFGADGNLPLDHDPKTAWALAHPEYFPLEVMQAPRELLVRVPGIGPRTADTLVGNRRRTI